MVCGRNTETRNAYRLFSGKLEEKRPLGRPKLGWEDNIKTDFGDMKWSGVDCIDVAPDQCKALVNTVMNL
jgi:hypothetical protein